MKPTEPVNGPVVDLTPRKDPGPSAEEIANKQKDIAFLFSVIKAMVAIAASTGLVFLCVKCNDYINEIAADLAYQKKAYKDAWYRDCYSEKKKYECDALWLAAHRGQQ